MIRNELIQLRELMNQKNFDYILILSDDFHASEYPASYFRVRELISGFTGSAGYLLISKDDAFLWTDGRYFLQANQQLKDSGIKLMKLGIDQSLNQILEQLYQENQVLAFDFKCVNYAKAMYFVSKGIKITDIHLQDYPQFKKFNLPKEKAFLVSEEYTGESTSSKLAKIRAKLFEQGLDYYLMSELGDVNYIFNIRGRDIKCTPYVLSFALVSQDQAIIYLDKDKLTDDIISYFTANQVEIKDYFEIYQDVERLVDLKVAADMNSISFQLVKDLRHVHDLNFVAEMKIIKNSSELKHLDEIHVEDGLAVFKLMHYLKKNHLKESMDEISIEQKVLNFRQESPNFIEESFESIVGFKENGAIIHYHAEKDNYKKIDSDGLLVVDSGGQYFGGTTDITRTFALGKISNFERESFTRVVKGVINLARCHFLEGVSGQIIDILARNALWNVNLNYRHGTGHGVAYMGSVHEGPNGIAYNGSKTIIRENMVFSDEPGYYQDGEFGIRIENEMVACLAAENNYGRFLKFKTITYCPIDLDAIDVDLLTFEEKEWLNNYHQEVYNRLSPLVKGELLEFLAQVTRKI